MKKLFLLPAILCYMCVQTAQAKTDIYSSNLISGAAWNSAQLFSAAVPFSPLNSLGLIDYKTKSLFSYVKLSLNTDAIPAGLAAFTAQVSVTITYYLEGSGTPIVVTKMLEVNYDPASGIKYKNVAVEQFLNASKIQVSVNANALQLVSGALTAAHQNFIKIQAFTEHERYYNFYGIFGTSYNLNVVTPTISSTYNAVDNEITLNWAPITFAEGYELEYTFIDDYSNTPGQYIQSNQLQFSFRNNSTKILLQQDHYTMPLVQEHGYLAYRVRGYGMAGADFDRIFYGGYIAAAGIDANNNQVFNVATFPFTYFVDNSKRHTNDKINWQSVTSFAEEGKSKTVVKYMDGTMRTRQTVTSTSTERNAIIAETVYDFQGRPAVNILPAPVDHAAIKYYPNFNQNTAGQPYSYHDFDFKGMGACDPFDIGPLKQQTGSNFGAGNYYSQYNPNKTIFNAYIPDANGYPFTRVTYMPDGTDRVVRQGNVGEIFQPGKTANSAYQNHDTKFYYGKPEQDKLDRLFGTNVGYAQFYQKNLVVDPNGQATVSYVDLDGKTIATALAGTAPAGMVPLNSLSSNPVTLDLLSGSDVINNEDHSITNSQSFLVSSNNTNYTFKYGLKPNTFDALTCAGNNYCLDCIYDLQITLVKDECGKVEYSNTSTVGSLTNLNFICHDANASATLVFSVGLDIGSYTITKKLSVNKQVAEYYADSILNDPHNSCLKTYDDFYNEAWNNRDTTRCMESCDACMAESQTAESASLVADAVRSCDSLWCHPQIATMCDMARMSMINDLTPGGQYAKYLDAAGNISFTADPISIFAPGWPAGSGVKTIYNTTSVQNISVTLPGEMPHTISYYLGSDALLEQLINNWPEDLSEQLLPLHPEYCYLQFCDLPYMQTSNGFDTKYMTAETYADAQVASITGNIDQFYLQDPLYQNLNGSLQSDLVTRFTNYTGQGNSIKQLAVFMANCPSGNNINSCPGVWGNGINDDDEWERFKNIYFNIKQEFIQKAREYYVTHDAGCCPNSYIGCTGNNCNIPPVWHFSSPPPNPYPCFSTGGGMVYFMINLYQNAKKRFTTINDISFPGMATPTQSLYDMSSQQLANAIQSLDKSSLCPSCPELEDFKMMIWYMQNKKWIQNGASVKADEIVGLKDVFRGRFLNSQNNETINITKTGNTVTISSNYCKISFTADTTINWETAEILPTCLEIKDYRSAKLHVMVDGEYKTVLNITSTCDLFYCNGKKPEPPVADNSCHCDSAYNNFKEYKLGDIVNYRGSCYIAKKPSTKTGTIGAGELPSGKNYWEKLCTETKTQACIDPFNIDFDSDVAFKTDLAPATASLRSNQYELRPGSVGSTFSSQSFAAIPANPGQIILGKNVTVLNGQNYRISFRAITSNKYTPSSLLLDVRINGHVVSSMAFVKNHLLTYTFDWNSGTNTYANVELINKSNLSSDAINIDQFMMICMKNTVNYVHADSSKNRTRLPVLNPKSIGVDGDGSRYIPANSCGCNNLCDADLPSPELPFLSCDSIQKEIAAQAAGEAYADYKDSVFAALLTGYYEKCMHSVETFRTDYIDAEYHYTLYYYDQSGNLVQTVPPDGVKPFTTSAQLLAVKLARDANATIPLVPPHFMATYYRHNSLNAVVRQETPDAGISEFFYDKLGRIVLSQNAKQKPANKASYTYYDSQGRNVEAGQIDVSGVNLKLTASNYISWIPFITTRSRTEITHSYYDYTADPKINIALGPDGQLNLRNRIATVALYATNAEMPTLKYDHAIHYQYDIAGNVTELLQDFGKYSPFGLDPTNVRFQSKQLAYKFDLVSGKVNELLYQKGFPDQFFYRYAYNADNKLTKVYTSRNGVVWENDARYSYYRHGPLARTELGTDHVQGTDFVYTLQGWLKGANGLSAGVQSDIGKDGNSTPIVPANIGYNQQNQTTAPDVYSYWWSYFNDDYRAIGIGTTSIAVTTQPLTTGIYNTDPAPLYDGNIRSMYTNLQPFGGLGMRYTYDQLNRIKEQTAYTYTVGNFALAANSAYNMKLNYDANGNIQTLLRNGDMTNPAMDDLKYSYYNANNTTYVGDPTAPDATNRLAYVTDAVANGNYPNDIDNQNAYNYKYDAIGNLIYDNSEGINSIGWNLQNKITQINKPGDKDLSFFYDPQGNRVLKLVKDNTTQQILKQEFYVRDALGTVLAIYKKNTDSTFIKEQQIYGSSRLGVYNQEDLIFANYYPIGQTPIPNLLNSGASLEIRPYIIISSRNATQYGLTNHLGNVLATIGDAKIIVGGNSSATLLTATDYYAFGMQMPVRIFISEGYRYGLNGQEKDDEVIGNGNHLSFHDYGYEPRTGKRWNPDPHEYKYPMWSPYIVFANNPIRYIDLDGREPTPGEAARMAAHVYGDKKDAILTGGWRVSQKDFGIQLQDATGLKSLVYEKVVNGKVTEYTYATAGTEDAKDWGENAKQPLGFSEQYSSSTDNAKAISEKLGSIELTFVGHSLGGGEAALSALVTDRKAITFNAAGVSDITKVVEGTWRTPLKSESKIDAYILSSDPLNILQNQSPALPDANGNQHYLTPTDLPSLYNGHSINSIIKNYGVEKPEEYKK